MKKWYVTYTILAMVEGEDFEEAKAAAEKFAEDKDFYHLINDMEVFWSIVTEEEWRDCDEDTIIDCDGDTIII